MGYCGICNNNNVTFTKVEGGFYCSGCDEIQYDDEMDKESNLRILNAAKRGKAEGWKIYPNIEGLGDDIDDVIREYEKLTTNHI